MLKKSTLSLHIHRFTVMMGGAWYDKLREAVPSMNSHDLGQHAVNAIQEQLGITSDPVKIHVEKLSNSIPQYRIGHSQNLDKMFTEIGDRKLPLSLVGSSYKGPAVNDCINNSRLEVEKITGTLLQ